ncbi:MAG: HEAT repeat domain-containing protein [Candidatus Sulfotelmatobacter sp.]
MDVFQPNLPVQDEARVLDPRLQPTPDYGRLGSDSNVGPKPLILRADNFIPPRSCLRLLHVAAVMAGIGLAVAVSSAGGMGTIWGKLSNSSIQRKNSSEPAFASSETNLDRQKPQEQAELLLERAVSHSDGATDQIEARVDGWRGKLKWNDHLGQLTTAALNSSDSHVRNSAIEVQLAAYGLSKSQPTVDALVEQARSADHTKKIWAFWGLGLLANRGIATDRVVQVLAAHLKELDRGGEASEDSRRWAVEGLALVGTTPTIAPLLDAMRNDPSAVVRERAACSLAESGMLSHNQRMTAVPRLIDYAEDPALDAQTRGWAFQALAQITRQRLPNDSAAWRNWYQNSAEN